MASNHGRIILPKLPSGAFAPISGGQVCLGVLEESCGGSNLFRAPERSAGFLASAALAAPRDLVILVQHQRRQKRADVFTLLPAAFSLFANETEARSSHRITREQAGGVALARRAVGHSAFELGMPN